ncbi:unnamed protein product [Medioppia subpectinata]|uniref:Uncharacterized protein n=1 Tax=Medioppia subpectinata TaxID=1979941 RepID=A0A7R9LXD5_9ACAR|nr:unnamed protein product [Medioppia subpectinata]CAD7649573.1 unnamed protein product [Medioppia subpectinata]CAG2122303.1 unnamed protein product [Medioppia subpectinata]CAG2122507.1 unnamed protein product [Medioppia subpectinata]
MLWSPEGKHRTFNEWPKRSRSCHH